MYCFSRREYIDFALTVERPKKENPIAERVDNGASQSGERARFLAEQRVFAEEKVRARRTGRKSRSASTC